MVSEVVRFLISFEIWIYIILGGVGLFYISRLFKAINYWRDATFGIEKEIAKRKFVNAITTIVILFVFAISEFMFASFSASALPSFQMLATPTLDVFATPTPTLNPINESSNMEMVEATATQIPSTCVVGVVELVSPKDGEEVKDVVLLEGSANIPSFGFYKYEYSQRGSEIWTTIAGGKDVKIYESPDPEINGEIGNWNTTQLLPGDYLLRLVVLDNENIERGTCTISVRVTTTQ